MRLRHIPGSENAIAVSPYVVHQPEDYRGRYKELFGNDHPLEIEVGMGKGKFIMELAMLHPEINYIGIERYSSVLLRALQKREELDLPNIYFMCVDAGKLNEIFAPEEISKIYLNFSDPWPKDRHAKRRLTSPEFMKVYDQILRKDGVVEFKTDNQGLFSYSLESIPEAGWKIDAYTRDLHHSEMAEGNVMTEYETKFSSMGHPICKLIACR
jgi:tRNA (guanine-N7-)-methyltransferase